MATVQPIECERQLAELLVQIKSNPSDQSWFEIETTAQTLANTLRIRDGPGMQYKSISSAYNV